MAEPESNAGEQDDVSFIRTDDMICLQCSESGKRVCLAAEGFGNRHCFLEPITNKDLPPEMPSCVFIIEQALSVRALQEMVTAETGELQQQTTGASRQQPPTNDDETNQQDLSATDATQQVDASNVTAKTGSGRRGAGLPGVDGATSGGGSGGGNRTLLYGHAVLLRHLHSGMCLATLPMCSSSDKLAFDVGLKGTSELGESCWWTVHPGSKQRSEGEKVRFGDDLILVSVATERYLHYTHSQQQQHQIHASSAPIAAVAAIRESTGLVNASFHSTHWSIAPFGTGLSRAKSVGFVFGGQVLRLLHGGDECLTVSPHYSSSTLTTSESNSIQVADGNQQQQQSADVVYEGGAVMNQARSLWRLDLIRTRWSGGFVQFANALRIRHITTGKYLGIKSDGDFHLRLLDKTEATVDATAFVFRVSKDDGKGSKTDADDDKDEEVIGQATVKYGDTSVFVQHVFTQKWLSYKSFATQRKGVGRVEEKQAILSDEGKMDDCLEISRSQEEEAKTARVIRKCDALFSKFIKTLDAVQQTYESGALSTNANDSLAYNSTTAATSTTTGITSASSAAMQASRRRSSAAAAAAAAAALYSPEIDNYSFNNNNNNQFFNNNGNFNQSSLTSMPFFDSHDQLEMAKCLEDLIEYFAPPAEGCEHEQEQNRRRALRNRQDLFQEEGILNLILDAIDKMNLISGCGLLPALLGTQTFALQQSTQQQQQPPSPSAQPDSQLQQQQQQQQQIAQQQQQQATSSNSDYLWDSITSYFYQLLAAIIKDNHTNCAQFAQSHRLSWLFSRLASQQASEGTGMLDVLHCVLVDSPEALNMLRESHIRALIGLLEKHGRDPKVLNVLCSLCVSNGVAIRSSQNTITNHLLPASDLLLQTRLVNRVASMKPNIYVCRVDNSAMYQRWYFELVVDHIELVDGLSPHLRVGWANTRGYLPYPASGSHWGANGVGDDLYSYAFDGQYLWCGGRPTLVRIPPSSTQTRLEASRGLPAADYHNMTQSFLDAYAASQADFVASSQQQNTNNNNNIQQQQTLSTQATRTVVDPFSQSPYLRLQCNDVIGCFIDLSVPTIQFTINGKQIFGMFKNFNVLQGGFFHPVVSFSAKVSCRFLFGANHGDLQFEPPTAFSPLASVLLPNQELTVEPCFSFGDLNKQLIVGPKAMPDCNLNTITDLVFIPQVVETSQIEIGARLENLRDLLADNMHELWCMAKIEDGWMYGDEHDEQRATHPYIAPLGQLPSLGRKYKLDLATQTIKTILGLGYRIVPKSSSSSSSASLMPTTTTATSTTATSSASNNDANNNNNQQIPQTRVKTYRLPNVPYLQPNNYKPAPLDLSNIEPPSKTAFLIEQLAENIHNIWAAEKINLKWTYKSADALSVAMGAFNGELSYADSFCEPRSCHLLPYKYVDDQIKLKNRQSALETVLTILAHGYSIEPTSSTQPASFANALASASIDQSNSPTNNLLSIVDASSTNQQQSTINSSLTPLAGGVANSPNSRNSSRPVSATSSLFGTTTAAAAVATGSDSLLTDDDALLSGHNLLLANAPQIGMRLYRAERTYAQSTGRWYYEVEICSAGRILIGWASPNLAADCPMLGASNDSWAFDCHSGHKIHANNDEPFGGNTQATIGDVIGCMLDLNDKTISYSLNGKLLLDSMGNESAFNALELLGFDHSSPHVQASFVPAICLDVNERVRVTFGQDVEQLRYFAHYGLQEGYYPFCVNMHKPIALWYNKREPNFANVDELDDKQVNVEVTRVAAGSESPPALKIAFKHFEVQERATWEYLRLSLPVIVNSELIDESEKVSKIKEIQGRQLRLAYEPRSQNLKFGHLTLDQTNANLRHPARLEQHMLQSGFSLADVNNLQRSFDRNSTTTATTLANSNDKHQATSADNSSTTGSQHQSFAQRLQRSGRQLVKTRSVDYDNSSSSAASRAKSPPQLIVPSFGEAQRMMAAEASQLPITTGKHVGFGLQHRSASSSLENISAANANDISENSSLSSSTGGRSSRQRSKSAFRSLLGSIKSSGNQSAATAAGKSLLEQHNQRPQSLTRGFDVPRISIQSGSGLLPTQDFSLLDKNNTTSSNQQQSAGSKLVRRLSRVGFGSSIKIGASSSNNQTSSDNLLSAAAAAAATSQQQNKTPRFDLAQLDAASLQHFDEYYFGVRIFPGQEPSHVMCGWVTSQFKHESLASINQVQRVQVVQNLSLVTGRPEICERRECYLLNAGQLHQEMHPTASASTPTSTLNASTRDLSSQQTQQQQQQQQASVDSGRANRGMLIGCFVDISTGALTFTVDGKLATKHRFSVEPGTRLYPAIFFQATTRECIQFELNRTPMSLPLSAAILRLADKHTSAQCPPRLRVQTLRTNVWSRVQNANLRPNALKLSDARGWSMLADEPLCMLALHIPEEDRCVDILELVEHEKLLKFHSQTLVLYGALCAHGNHKVAHTICGYVDQRQLLYAINSDYLAGSLRHNFADLLIALHLEFHAYGRHLTQNEFIVPINKRLLSLYCNSDSNNSSSLSSLVNAFSRIESVSIRTEMKMSPICCALASANNNNTTTTSNYNAVTTSIANANTTTASANLPINVDSIPTTSIEQQTTAVVAAATVAAAPSTIHQQPAVSDSQLVKSLSTPYFPINILKKLVFKALEEAVMKGNLPIRDLPGGSSENLFVPLLKLADRLLLIGCVTNYELCCLLSLIDPQTFERPSPINATNNDFCNETTSDDITIQESEINLLALNADSTSALSSVWKPTVLQTLQLAGCERAQIGLLRMRDLDEHVKLIVCHLLQHLLDIQLRHRIESIMAFSVNFVGQLQLDQRRRYDEIKQSKLPSHLTAKKTREFRCSPTEQMRYILNFKNAAAAAVNNSSSDEILASDDLRDSLVNTSPSSESLRSLLRSLHSSMMKQIRNVIDDSSSSSSTSNFELNQNHFINNNRIMQSFNQNNFDKSYDVDDESWFSLSKLMKIVKLIGSSLLQANEYSSNNNSNAKNFDLNIDDYNNLIQTNNKYNINNKSIAQTQTESLHFVKQIVSTIVSWAQESTIENKQLVRQMFHLLLRCYNGVGELIEALKNSYVISENSTKDVVDLLQVLSKVRALLAVQMGSAEEEVMRDCLWTLVNNVVFFQHPDLIRILRVHENVMHVMMNTLSKSSGNIGSNVTQSSNQQQQQLQQSGDVNNNTTINNSQQRQSRLQSISGLNASNFVNSELLQQQVDNQQQINNASDGTSDEDDGVSKMVVSCCRFLCYFCRSSARNQKAMFEHLNFLLDHSNILLSRPSLRGSTPLDVACSSLMENHELVLALRESYLEKIAIYLSRCGLQSNQELVDKGYADVGWDPVEGERYLDFLRFCVWVNGESVEENSNLVIRLLIRRPECLGPALRGEGQGLFAAIKDAIAMADSIRAQQLAFSIEDERRNASKDDANNSPDVKDASADEDNVDDTINLGSAILSFYCALVDLLGRCAPDLASSQTASRHESIRARSILRSLVPMQDLQSAISLRFALVNPQFCAPDTPACSSLLPSHKQSLVLFLERVYGVQSQETFFALLEDAFLPDMRAATMLERSVNQNSQQQQSKFLDINTNNNNNLQVYGSSSSSSKFKASTSLQQQQQLGSGEQHSSNDQATNNNADNDESAENEITLALNRYLGNSAIPLLIKESHYFKNAENYANLMEPTLHTVYRLSKVKILTKGQREAVSDLLIALTRRMQPQQLLKLLRKLTVDVAVLDESTTVALRLLTLHYERCSKYYRYAGGTPGVVGTASEEERRLTMVLFTNIFDSLSLMDYDPELFENALPCLNALACALPPDYSLTEARDLSVARLNANVATSTATTTITATTTGVGSKQQSSSSSNKSKHRQQQQQQQQHHSQQQQQSAANCPASVQQQATAGCAYEPTPVDTSAVKLNEQLAQLAQRFSEHYHDLWACRKLDRDWTYGEVYNFKLKKHPRLKPYSLLTQHERDRYREPVEEALKALIAMRWIVERVDGNSAAPQASDLRSSSPQMSGSVTPTRSPSRFDLFGGGNASSSSSLAVGDGFASPSSLSMQQRELLIRNYNPQPVDTSNLSLSRELQNLAELSAENAHDLWARKTIEEWRARVLAAPPDELRAQPILLHPMMVPYDLLTDKEKRKNRNTSQQLLKYILFEGYKVHRADETSLAQQQASLSTSSSSAGNHQRGRINSRANESQLNAVDSTNNEKRRFAYSILGKLLSYADTVNVKLELLKPSANFSRRSSFKQSDRDVKFFSKVVLPLIERYFTAHRDFFLANQLSTNPIVASLQQQVSPSTSAAAAATQSPNSMLLELNQQQQQQLPSVAATTTTATTNATNEQLLASSDTSNAQLASVSSRAGGCATAAEKEMLGALFCKLALVLRNKLPVIGPDARIFVRCLQVLTRALDARSLSEDSQDFVKSAMLSFFNKTAFDLSNCVRNLKLKRYNALRGITIRTNSSLYYIHLAVLPTLTAFFDHIASSESGKYLLVGEIQLACHKILHNLYVLGTRLELASSHMFCRTELERHRHSYGNCLAAFAAAFPVPFLQIEFALTNSSINISNNNNNNNNSESSQQQQQQTNIALQQTNNSTINGSSNNNNNSTSRRRLDSDASCSVPKLEELLKLVSLFVKNGFVFEAKNLNKKVNATINAHNSTKAEHHQHTSQHNNHGINNLHTVNNVNGNSSSGGAHNSLNLQANSNHSNINNNNSSSNNNSNINNQYSINKTTSNNINHNIHGNSNSLVIADNNEAIIDVIIPMLCSYLSYWYLHSMRQQQQNSTNVALQFSYVNSTHLNDLLRDILLLIKSQVGTETTINNDSATTTTQQQVANGASWMVTIATHVAQLIVESRDANKLTASFVQLSTKIAQYADSVYRREEVMRGYLKSTADDTTAIEERIQEEFHLLVRDIYAFYPLLIRFVDYRKGEWLASTSSSANVRGRNLQSLSNNNNKFSQHNEHMQMHNNIANSDNVSLDGNSSAFDDQLSASCADLSDDVDNSNFDINDKRSVAARKRPEQVLFSQVAAVFDIWSNSQYFQREEQNFISQHEIDNMALIMQASNKPGRVQMQSSSDLIGADSSGGSNATAMRKKSKRKAADRNKDRERQTASSLLVVALKRLLAIGMDPFEGRERELVQEVKEKFLKREVLERVEELVRNRLTQPARLEPSDELGWQHILYARLGAKPTLALNNNNNNSLIAQASTQLNKTTNAGLTMSSFDSIDHTYTLSTNDTSVRLASTASDSSRVKQIINMARVFYGLHIIDHPNLQRKTGQRSCVSTQRRRVVIACFRMTSLHSLPRHRAINIFLKSYCDSWLLDENTGQERLVEQLTQTFEEAEQKINLGESLVHANDPLSQLITTLSRQATTERTLDFNSGGVDILFLNFADIFRMSCGGDEDDEDDDDGGGGGDNNNNNDDDGGNGNTDDPSSNDCNDDDDNDGDDDDNNSAQNSASTSSIHEQEMEKQRLLFQQSRLSDRGVAEMILLYIAAHGRSNAIGGGGGGGANAARAQHNSQRASMVLSTLKLGISILRGGNVDVQRRMLRHLKERKDVAFFTSIQSLMNSCSVLDLDAFERNQRAEALGVRSSQDAQPVSGAKSLVGISSANSSSIVGEKSMHDAEFTCKLFRFFQLLCEGHNLEFQNYLRTQVGNTSTVNVVISTVDYLLRLQESIMDFYWHYSSRDVIDASGTENFIKAITIAKQVFSTLTESIQGPCPQNQQALAHSRLWHAVGGFLFLFAHLQDKLSRNSSQLNLLIELLDLQKEMVIMMLSMLEGNVVNGTIGKQMVETLVESAANVEIILKFFDMFLKLPRLTSSASFHEFDRENNGWISAVDLRKAMEQHKIYTAQETDYLLSCCEPNHDGKIDYREFIDRFHQPAKDIGFNLAVLLTNLAEHITNEPRLQRFLETASTVLNYFEPFLGRIEIMGSSKRIERVYFEIKESTIAQWWKPQIQESKRAFFYSIVTEGDGKEKLEAFVNFCEDTIFEMQHASNILGEEDDEPPTKADKYPSPADSAAATGGDASSSSDASSGLSINGDLADNSNSFKTTLSNSKNGLRTSFKSTNKASLIIELLMIAIGSLFSLAANLKPSRIRRKLLYWRRMSYARLVLTFVKFLLITCLFSLIRLILNSTLTLIKFLFNIMVGESNIVLAANKSTPILHQQQQHIKSNIVKKTSVADSLKVNSGNIQTSSTFDSTNVNNELQSADLSMQTTSVNHHDSDTHLLNNNNNLLLSSSNATTQQRTNQLTNTSEHQSMLTTVDNEDQNYLLEELINDGNIINETTQRSRQSKTSSLLKKLSKLTNYNQKIISFLARNFYTIKLLALVTAFVINFILLFYKVTVLDPENLESNSLSSSSTELSIDSAINNNIHLSIDSMQIVSKIDKLNNKYNDNDSFDDKLVERKKVNEVDDENDEEISSQTNRKQQHKTKAKLEVDNLIINNDDLKANKSEEEEEGEVNDDSSTELAEVVVMEEKYYYLQPILTCLACIHSVFSLCMLIAYYHLKVPLVIFKREKEITRKLEFDGLYITEEPDSENWWNGQWDRLVISARSFPVNYWDKFVKKRVREKYREQYDYDQLSELLGMQRPTTKEAANIKQQLESGGKFSLKSTINLITKLLTSLFGQANLRQSWLFKIDWRYQLWKAGVTLTDQSFQYQLSYLIFSLAGHYNKFFFAAHLLDVAVGFKKLRTILQSVTHNGRQLVLTVMLLTIVVYIYTVIAFNFFRKFYVQSSDDESSTANQDDSSLDEKQPADAELKCHSMLTCFVYHLYQGVRSGGGIGDVIEAPDGDPYEVYRIIFDITFFFSVIIILLAIIQGLIIDAFGELRDQLLTVAADMESNCFICGIGKDVLDKVPRGFDTHVQKEHNLANYMFFLMHLINKPHTDYTGQESYVWELYQRRCWDFFPVGECFRTQSEEELDSKNSRISAD